MAKIFKRISVLIIVIVGVAFILNIPVSTRQGINYDVTSRSIPLYVKIAAFIYRDFEYRDLSRRIVGGMEGDKNRIDAIYGWTMKNIRDIPPDFPVVDDHIWSIVVRGYGAVDQKADVFSALASYAGYEAFWDNLPASGDKGLMTIAFVKMDGKWYGFDIDNGKKFIDIDNDLTVAPDGIPYARHFKEADRKSFESRRRRPGNQKIFPRIINELKKAF